MTQKHQIPDLATVKARAVKIEAICKRADANILVLDEIIAMLDENIRYSPVYQSRLRRAKRLLNFPEDNLENLEISP
jgi:hypothetical protein